MAILISAFLLLSSYAYAHTLLLYYKPSCPYSREVLGYLNDIGKTVPMKDVTDDSEASRELKRIGGYSMVPCLVIDGIAKYDADEIIDWLGKNQNELQPAPQKPVIKKRR